MDNTRMTATFPTPPSLIPGCELIDLSRGRAVWEISVSDDRVVYMRESGDSDASDCVVLVDARAFYEAWRATGVSASNGFVCPPVERMPEDYKYHHAAAGFSSGREYPVPLANVGYYRGQVGFGDGITRTLWLLANGATAFPIRVDSLEEGLALCEEAGLGIPPYPRSRLAAT
jgi:hypothetical protein